MEELVVLVSDKTGLSERMARVAVRTVVSYLEVRLPPSVAQQIDATLGGAGATRGVVRLAKELGDNPDQKSRR